jgi:hypothetical protein
MLIRCDRPFAGWGVGRSGAFYTKKRHPLYHEPGALHHVREATYRGWDERTEVL